MKFTKWVQTLNEKESVHMQTWVLKKWRLILLNDDSQDSQLVRKDLDKILKLVFIQEQNQVNAEKQKEENEKRETVKKDK